MCQPFEGVPYHRSRPAATGCCVGSCNKDCQKIPALQCGTPTQTRHRIQSRVARMTDDRVKLKGLLAVDWPLLCSYTDLFHRCGAQSVPGRIDGMWIQGRRKSYKQAGSISSERQQQTELFRNSAWHRYSTN